MRIVVCSSQVPFEYGGAEILAEALCDQLRARGHSVALVQVPQQWQPKEEVIKNYLVWRMLELTHTYDQRPIDRLVALKYPAYATRHPHKVTWLVHQLRQAYDLYGTEFGFLGNQEDDREIRQAITEMDTATISESAHTFAISANVAGRLLQYNGLGAQVLYPPPAMEGHFVSESYGDYVLSVSRLAPIKRVDLLIEAMALVETPVRCLIGGRGSDEKRLRRLVRQLELEDRIEFLGFVTDKDLLSLYSRALTVYYAPLDEDYGLATVEAFKSRRPVLTASDSGGTLEFVVDDETGYVTDPGEPLELARRIDQLYANKATAARLGSAGYELVEPIAWDTTLDRLLEA